MADEALRSHLVRLLTWHDAHASFEDAVQGLDPSLRGIQPEGAPYSPWQLLEHLRLTQFDILDFCQNTAYWQPKWPDDYWPESQEPPTGQAWEQSIASYIRDRAALVELAEDPAVDLFARVPHGTGQTYLRELLLVADHSSYHVGELVLVRRLLGSWPAP